MNASSDHEFMCPQCSHINALSDEAIRNRYQEKLTQCENCGCQLEVIPADGIGDKVNLVVSIAGSEYLLP